VPPQGGCSIDSNVVEQSIPTALDPNGDQTGNGIPNWWVQQYGFSPFDASVAAGDADATGCRTFKNFSAGLIQSTLDHTFT